MRATISCSACGTVLGVPKAGMPKDGLSCNWCGYVNLPVPVTAAETAAAPAAAMTSPAPSADAVERERPPTSARHPWADDEDDNGQPYVIPKSEIKTRRCVECNKEIEIQAVVCVFCGFDTSKKEKVERTFHPIDREWESGWPFPRRMALFLVFQALNIGTLVFSLGAGGSVPVSIFGIVLTVGLQAFLCGTYDRVRIRRNKKGQTEITMTWRICFIPGPAKKVNWKEHEGITFGHYNAIGVTDWILMIILLPACIIPAIVFWWYIIKSDRFFAALARDRGFPETYLYRGMNEKQAKEIAQTATDATGLPINTPL
jgi:hypothetical protein